MAINERLVHTASAAAAAGTGNQEEGLILHLDANDVDSYDGDGSEWVDITDHEFTPATDVSEHFNTVLYTGDGQSSIQVTGAGFQPDLIIQKNRDASSSFNWYDSVRGATKNIYSSGTAAESTYSGITSFDSDGFTNGSGENTNNNDYVAWSFKAGGAAVSNTDGATTSQVSANQDLGFSIVKHTGTGSNTSIGHGLGIAPELIITKNTTDVSNWSVSGSVGGLVYGTNKLQLNTSAAIANDSNEVLSANTTTFTVGSSGATNGSGDSNIHYCFATKRGVSKVGSYQGTSAAGNKITLGFEPAFLIVKRATGGTANWFVFDNKRTTMEALYPNASTAEGDYSTLIEFNSDGFTNKANNTGLNNSSSTYLYYAVAKNTNFDDLIDDTDLELHLDAASYSGSGSTWTADTGSNATISGASYDEELGDWFDFDGNNDKVTITAESPVSLEMWVYANSTSGIDPLLGHNSITSNYIYWNTGDLTVNGGVFTNLDKVANKWTHIAVVESGSNIICYKNGNEIQTISGSLGTYTEIGGRTAGTAQYLTGRIGQVRMYSSALTQDQIRQNFNFTKNDYPNGINFINAGDRANWLPEGSWNFDSGANEYFAHTGGSFQNRIGTANFAVCAWVNTDSVSSASKFVISTVGYSDGSNQGWAAYIYEDDIWFDAKSGTNNIPIKVHNVLSTNTWHHIVWQRTDSIWECYLDGQLQTNSSTQKTDYLTANFGNDNATDSNLIIGRNWQTNDYQWDGQISDIKILNKALTQEEVTAQFGIKQFDIG